MHANRVLVHLGACLLSMTPPPRALRAASHMRMSSATNLAYDLDARFVELDLEDGSTGRAYLTEERPEEHRPRASRAIVLIPEAAGIDSSRTRHLADRLAVFCFAMVLVPDLNGGALAHDESDETWVSSLAPRRVDAAMRDWTIYLRADHRVGPVALVGAGAAAEIMLRWVQHC